MYLRFKITFYLEFTLLEMEKKHWIIQRFQKLFDFRTENRIKMDFYTTHRDWFIVF